MGWRGRPVLVMTALRPERAKIQGNDKEPRVPDWSYRTLFQPLLFRLPPAAARDVCLGVMGPLGRSPFGGALIDFLGHMHPPAALERRLLGLRFASAAGLGCGLDPDG